MPRWLELVTAAVLLALLSPVLLLVAVVVRLRQGRPVLYRQLRVGKDGETFRLLKFRTMRPDADRERQLTVGVDQRVTPFGAWLRRRRLDELPQLVNVLRGDMSFVGARPEVPEYILPDLPDQAEVLRHRPGVTDPASLAFRDEAALLAAAADPEEYYRTTLLPAKVHVSADYLRHRNLASDVHVMLRTARCLVAPSAAATPEGFPAERAR